MNQQRRCKGVKVDNKKCTRKCDGKYCWQHMQTGCGKAKESKTNQIGCARGKGKESKTNQIGCARGKAKESKTIQTQHKKTQTGGGGDDDMNKLSCFTTGKTKVCMETDTTYYCSTDNKKDTKSDYYRCSEHDGSCDIIKNENEIENPYKCEKIEKLPGLKWDANNCYFNSTIKLLLTITPLMRYIMKNREVLKKNTESATRNFVRIIESIYLDIVKGHIDTVVLEQEQLCRMVKPQIQWTEQNDPMEVFTGIFADFEKTMKKLKIEDKFIENLLYTIIYKKRNNLEIYSYLPLTFDEQPGEYTTIQNLVDDFLGNNVITKFPEYVLLQIGRIKTIFYLNEDNKPDYKKPPRQLKIETKIDYRNDLKLMNYRYRLEGVIYHSGGAGGGHYTCRAKFGGKWWDHNDNDVHEIPRDAVNDTIGIYQGEIRRDDKYAPLSHYFLYRKI